MSKYIDRWSTREIRIFIYTMYRASICSLLSSFCYEDFFFKAIATVDTSVAVKYEKTKINTQS